MPRPDAREQHLGTFPVCAGAAQVAAFRAAISPGAAPPATPEVPLTFPMRWLTQAPIRDAILAAVLAPGRAEDTLAVHVDQRITMALPLCIDADYALTLSADGPGPDNLLVVQGVLHDMGGAQVCTLEGTFALVSRDRTAPA